MVWVSLYFFLPRFFPSPPTKLPPTLTDVELGFRMGRVSLRQIQPCHNLDTQCGQPSQLSASAARLGLCKFVWNCQNAGNFNVTASLNVTGLRKCRIHLRTVNRIHLALLMWSSVKDRFLRHSLYKRASVLYTFYCQAAWIFCPLPFGLIWRIWDFFFTLYKQTYESTDLSEVYLIIRIFSYLDCPFSSWVIYACNNMECVRSSHWLLLIPVCLKDSLCVSVCLYMLKYDVSVCNSVCSPRGIYVIFC